MSAAHPDVYPKAISAFQYPAFKGVKNVPVDFGHDLSKISLITPDQRRARRILSQLQSEQYLHMGRLEGEYAVMNGSMLALDRDGVPIRINCSPDSDIYHHTWFHDLEDFMISELFIHARDTILNGWENLQLFPNAFIPSERHGDRNFYHFMTGFLPRLRHTADTADTMVCVPREFLDLPYQIDLIRRTAGHRLLSFYNFAARVRDPIVVYEPFTRAALHWLRDKTKLRAEAGSRRVYIARRKLSTGRSHGTIQVSPEMEEVIRQFGFETVDFGSGEIPIAEQVRMLDGAGVVLSAHGANLTNLLYLTGNATLIELLPDYWSQPGYMQIAAMTDLRYFGLVCEVDDQFRLQVRPDDLRALIRDVLKSI